MVMQNNGTLLHSETDTSFYSSREDWFVVNAELSDMLSIVKKYEGPPDHDAHILIIQILEGKTNAGKIVWGRVMRHKHVNMCLIGALAFYLMARFDMTGEKFDFSDNSSWFKRKFLVSPTHSKNFDKEM
jgi:hypothetical protein